MKAWNKRRYFFLFFLSVFFPERDMIPEVRNFLNLDSIRYELPSGFAVNHRKTLLRFHDLFRESRKSLPENLWMGGSDSCCFTIRFVSHAGEFRNRTGLDARFGGIYDPSRMQFVFQNPVSLEKRGILESTILHELCHESIHSGWIPSQSRAEPADSHMDSLLEEAYCQGAYPVGIPEIADPICPGCDYSGWQKTLEHIYRRPGSRNRAVQVLGHFGRFLMEKGHRQEFFFRLRDEKTRYPEKDGNRSWIQKHFRDYRSISE